MSGLQTRFLPPPPSQATGLKDKYVHTDSPLEYQWIWKTWRPSVKITHHPSQHQGEPVTHLEIPSSQARGAASVAPTPKGGVGPA